MNWWKFFRTSNRQARILVGILLAGFFCIQCTQSYAFRQSQHVVAVSGQAIGSHSPEILDRLQRLARTDHIAVLEYCLANYQGQYRDYTCTFIKQERIGDLVGKEQVIDVKFLDEPFSVAMKWTPQTAPRGDRVLFVEGKYGNQMLIRPTGILGGLIGTVKRPVDGPEVMKSTLRPVNVFGFERTLENLLNVYRQAKANGDLKQVFGGFAEVDGRKTIVLIRTLPAKHDYPSHKTVTFIDLEYLVPLAVEGYDWRDQPTCSYIYKDIRFNVGLADEDFMPQANDMKPPGS